MNLPKADRSSSALVEPRWKTYACLALLIAALAVVVAPKVRLLQWRIAPDANTALDEALQWRQGSLALSHRFYESARVGDRYYNVTGLAFTLISVVATTLGDAGASVCRHLDGTSNPAAFPPLLYVVLVALPLPLAAWWAFRRVMQDSAWAAVLAFYLIAGTSLWHVLAVCQSGSIYYINHVLAVVGLLIFTADLLGRRRLWPAALGLCLAAWSRQMTILYAVPLLWIAWREYEKRDTHGIPSSSSATGGRRYGSWWGRRPRRPAAGEGTGTTASAAAGGRRYGSWWGRRPRRPAAGEGTGTTASSAAGGRRYGVGWASRLLTRHAVIAMFGVAVATGLPALLNTLKFGSPLETGYARLYEGRTDRIGRRAQEAVFGVRYVPMHAWAMNAAYPRWDVRKSRLYADTADVNGGSIWLTSPILIGVFVTWRRWWRDPARRALMLGTLPVILGLMCYHTTGADGAGCYRYSLDFIPVWLVVIAPYILTDRGKLLTTACLAYSTVYFYHLPP